MTLHRLDELGIGQIAVHHRAIHRQIGCVDLQQQTGFVDRLVFVLHLTRDRREILVLRTVKSVEHRRGYDARRRGGHEALSKLAVRDFLEARDFVLDRLHVEILQFGLTFRSVLLLADMREAPHQARHQFGKFFKLTPAPPLGDASKAAHALRNIGLEADALLFSVITDVDTGCELLLHHMANGLVHFGGHFLYVECFACLLADQQIRQFFVARQAADVGGENAIPAENHENLRRWVVVAALVPAIRGFL